MTSKRKEPRTIRVTRTPFGYVIELRHGDVRSKLASITGKDAARRAADAARVFREQANADEVVWDSRSGYR